MLVTHLARQPARRLAQLAFILSGVIAASSAALAQGEVNIYSYREPRADRSAAQGLHREDRHQDQRRVRLRRSQRAPRRRRKEQPRRPALHRRCRPPLRGQGCGPHAARGLRRAEGRDPRPLSRSRQSLVRRHHALAHRLRVQGAREAGRDHLRGAGRPEVEGQDLHPLGPARLQHLAARHDHRPQGRGGGRGMAEGAQGQPGAQARRRRPRAGARHLSRASATWRSATPTTWR